MTTARLSAALLLALGVPALGPLTGAARLGAAPPAGSPKQLVVYPPQVSLNGPRDEQRLVVLGVWADGRKWDLTRAATCRSSRPKIATVT
jgi:hypothetical protein